MADMDVDAEPQLADPFSSSAFSEERSKFILSRDQLIEFNTTLNSEGSRWQLFISTFDEDPTQWKKLVRDVLVILGQALAETDLKDYFMGDLTIKEASNHVKKLTGEELDEWKSAVRKGVKEGNWADAVAKVRKPEALWKPTSPVETPEEQAARLDAMFTQDYHGEAAELFAGALKKYNKFYNSSRNFGRCIPIVQSSGTGKSRLVAELGNQVVTLSVCFRKSKDPKAGWPPADEPAYSFFKDERNPEYKGEELAAAFLGALMDVVAEKLEARDASVTSLKARMEDWRLDTPKYPTKSSRHRCFQQVRDKAEALLLRQDPSVENMRMKSPKPDGNAPSPSLWHIELYKVFCSPYAQKLAEVLKAHEQRTFVIAFDECSYLGKPTPDTIPERSPLWIMSLIALQRIIKAADAVEIPGLTIWHLLLDTNSSAFDLTPSGPLAPSQRLAEDFIQLPPWPYLGFNQMVDKNHLSTIKKPSDSLTIEHQKVYGRPYWSYLTTHEVLSVAIHKLFFASNFYPTNEDHVFAAFAVRVALEIADGEASERLAANAVRSHMRILCGVVGSLVITTSPSEPMLAIAAAQALNSSTEVYQRAMHTLLEKLVLKGCILDRGLQGELCSRLLLMIARDKTNLPSGGPFVETRPKTDILQIRAVRMDEFLKTLLGPSLGVSLKQAALCSQLIADMSEVWINFTHFVQLSKAIDEIDQSTLLQAWSSGFAFQCDFNQPVIDGFLVAYRGQLDEPFVIDNLFMIPWQTKAKAKAAKLALARQLTAPFISSSQRTWKPGHLVIMMDLNTAAVFMGSRGEHVSLDYCRAEAPETVWNGYRGEQHEPERYCLNIRGHSIQTYPIIEGFEEQFHQLFQRYLSGVEPELAMYETFMARSMDMVKL